MTDPAQERLKSLEQRLAQEPQSPLFARLADCYLQAGRANDALRLCDDGLALYPYYSTAHLVKAKVLNHLGMTAEARHAYEVVQEFLPTNESIARLVSSIAPAPDQQHEVETAVEEAAQPKLAPVAVPDVVDEHLHVEEAPQAIVEEFPQEAVVAVDDTVVTASEPTTASEEPFTVAEEPAAIAEEPVIAEELVTEEPQGIEPAETPVTAEDDFGFGQQSADVQPAESSAADKLGLDLPPEQQQSYSDFVASFEQAPAAAKESPFDAGSFEAPQGATEAEAGAEPQPEAAQVDAPVVETPLTAPEPLPATDGGSASSLTSDWEDAFSQLQQPVTEATEQTVPSQTEEENPFAVFGTEQATESVDAEPYEEFTARVRMELFGTEDSISLEDYLGQTDAPATHDAASDEIGDLAEKLKSSPKITPPVINFSEKAPRSASDVEAAGGSGFVTPTLAEIYIKQGWFDDAIKAYRALAANKPAEKEKFEQRIAEIEEMKKGSK